jgi:putative salt-induced outer membrane protein YdiY
VSQGREWLLGLLAIATLASAARGQAPIPPAEPVEDLHNPQVLTLPALEVVIKAPKLWTGGVELGVNGVDGNSEIFKLHAGGNAKRTTEESIWTSELSYNFATASWSRKENRLLSKTRHEWPLPDSPWSMFLSGSGEYDEFKAFEARVASHTGVGHDFLNNERTIFKGRLGAGASREIGGPQNRFLPEGLLGVDWEQKITKRQKIKSTFEFFPDLTEVGNFRGEAKVAYEVLIDPELNLTLKIGLLDRYDSTPEGKRPNDLEYFAVLLWKF